MKYNLCKSGYLPQAAIPGFLADMVVSISLLWRHLNNKLSYLESKIKLTLYPFPTAHAHCKQDLIVYMLPRFTVALWWLQLVCSYCWLAKRWSGCWQLGVSNQRWVIENFHSILYAKLIWKWLGINIINCIAYNIIHEIIKHWVYLMSGI